MGKERQSGRSDASGEQDALDDALVIWAREIPDLDPLTEGIVERIGIMSHALEESLEQTLAEFELDRRSFHVLGRLRSYGKPYQRSAGMLAKDMRLSSGAMTNRLDQLEKAGLVKRLPDLDDRRALHVELTDKGHKLWADSLSAQANKEAQLAAALDERELAQLNKLLRKVLTGLEEG